MPTQPELARRQVLCGAALAVLVPATVVGCGSPGGATQGGNPAPTGGGGGAATPTSGAGTGTGALAALADIPVGQGKLVNQNGVPVLVVRTAEAEVKAFDARCPHQSSVVAAPKSGVITCPSHGSQFDGTSGALRKGPATTGLTAVPVRVSNGQILPA